MKKITFILLSLCLFSGIQAQRMYFRKGVHELALQGFSYNTIPFYYDGQYNVIGDFNIFNAFRYNYHLNRHWSLRSAFTYARGREIVYLYNYWTSSQQDIALLSMDLHLGAQYTFALPKSQLYIGMELGAGNFSSKSYTTAFQYQEFQASTGLITGFRYFLSKSFSLRIENTIHYIFTRDAPSLSLAQLMLAYHFHPQRNKEKLPK